MALAAQCELGSRHACDEAELEGLRPAAAVALPLPALPTLALAVSLLLAIISSLIKRTRRASSRSQQPGPGVRGRRLAAQVNPTTPAAQQAAPLPFHPAAAGTSFVAQRRSPAAAALLGAADAAASMLLLPVSVLQTAKHVLLGQRAGTAAPRTPETAGGLGSQHHGGGGGSGSGRRIAHYGLGYGEAESEEDEWEGGESELTQAALRQLQQSPQFQGYLRARGLTAADVGASARKLRLYRRLRRLDPQGFLALLRPGSRAAFDSQVPSRLVLVAEYLLSTAAMLLTAAALYHASWAWAGALPAGARAVVCAALLWLLARQWLRARPTAGPLFGLYYEELEWGHGAPGWRCLAAGTLELAYVLGSAGAGVPVSLALRCSGRRQSVGELLAGVRVVREVQSTAQLEGGEQ